MTDFSFSNFFVCLPIYIFASYKLFTCIKIIIFFVDLKVDGAPQIRSGVQLSIVQGYMSNFYRSVSLPSILCLAVILMCQACSLEWSFLLE